MSSEDTGDEDAPRRDPEDKCKGLFSVLAKEKRLRSCGYSEVDLIDKSGAGELATWTRFRCKRPDGTSVVRQIRRTSERWEIQPWE